MITKETQQVVRSSLQMTLGFLQELYNERIQYKQDAEAIQERLLIDVSQTALGFLNEFFTVSQTGSLSVEAAQGAALEALRHVGYGSNGYFFVTDEHLTILAHPNSSLIGSNLQRIQESGRGASVQDILGAIAGGGGFFVYQWPAPGSTLLQEKLGYITPFPPWKWYLATGAYLPEIERETNLRTEQGLQLLRQALQSVRVLDTGHILLFDKNGEPVYPSTTDELPFTLETDLATGTPIFSEMIAAAQTENHYVRYRRLLHGAPTWYESYVYEFAPLGWYVASSMTSEELLAPARSILVQQLIVLAGTTLCCLLLGIFWARRITRPLESLTQRVGSLSLSPETASLAEAPSTPVESDDREIAQLSESFDKMKLQLEDQVHQVVALTKEQERISSEIHVAKETQAKILPTKALSPAALRTVDLHGLIHPAKEVAGDFYDFFFIDAHLLCFCIGDVADKGMSAAWTMTMIMTLERVFGHASAEGVILEPHEILQHVNTEFCEQTHSFDMITLFLATLDLRTGELLYSHGGHLPPFLLRSDGTCHPVSLLPCRPLGVKKDTLFHPQSLRLEPGDRLCLYTDGAVEATNPEGAPFSQEELGRFVATTVSLSALSAIEKIELALQNHTAGHDPHDDIGLLYIHYKGNGLPCAQTITLSRELSEIHRAQHLLLDMSPPLSQSERLDAELVIEEILKNILDYAPPEPTQESISLSISLTSEELELRFVYNGPFFDPRDYLAAPTKGPHDIGGKGLLIVSRLVDKIDYLRDKNTNTLTTHKKMRL